jgi:hypothetical protein
MAIVKAPSDRSSGILRVVPHCQAINEFPDFVDVEVFMCCECEEPVEVEPPKPN